MSVGATVPARAHLAGNPSDGYGGAVLSVTIPDLAAVVEVEASPTFQVTGPIPEWRSLGDLVSATHRHGHGGGDRLVTAGLAALVDVVADPAALRPGRFRWSSTIPRSVGLGGSSAIVIATIVAALEWWEIDDRPDPMSLAQIALTAETEGLGIAAGLADRTVQALGGVVLTDCRAPAPSARRIEVPVPVDANVLWHDDAAAPSGDYHDALRRRVDAGDSEATTTIGRLAALADVATAGLEQGDIEAFTGALDSTLDLRRALGAVPAAALAGVDELRRAGAAVNFAGSGGALVVVGDHAVPDGWGSVALGIPPGRERV